MADVMPLRKPFSARLWRARITCQQPRRTAGCWVALARSIEEVETAVSVAGFPLRGRVA
jgi:hypothetical protein